MLVVRSDDWSSSMLIQISVGKPCSLPATLVRLKLGTVRPGLVIRPVILWSVRVGEHANKWYYCSSLELVEDCEGPSEDWSRRVASSKMKSLLSNDIHDSDFKGTTDWRVTCHD